ncbi:DUF6434 domain-containing protein [Mesorhizobium opportunistum]|uniref:DUF6434 domain-containing protein n=1 Tax=Mesorhizobium opportunistum TaxID=593909 RepID=A0ABV1YA32_9HYPH|nr:DUF6434 domain-containing protein [Mesorhizobium sp.]
MKAFDWHADTISRAITKSYRNTQNVRRCLTRECGDAFRFDRLSRPGSRTVGKRRWGTQPTNGSGARLKSGKRSFS